MATFLEALGQVARQTYCFALGNFDNAARSLGRVAPGAAAVSQVSGAVRAQLCNGPPDPTALPPPEFTGGQCVGTLYEITWNRFIPGLGNQPQSEQREGPIRVSRALDPSDNNDSCGPGDSFTRATLFSSGSPVNMGSGCAVTVTNIVVTPLFGGPNNCGDTPPDDPGPPGDIIIEGDDITYEGDDNVSITVPTSFIFAPVYLAFDGSLRVPVSIDVGGVNFNGELTITPEFKLEINPTFNPPGPGEPDDPDGIGEPGEPSDPIDDVDELESTIVGVLVFSDIDSDAGPSGILFSSGPDIFVPRVASVQFAIKTSNSIGWTPDIDVKNLECYVPCPAPQGAVAVRVSPMPGVQSRFTAVRGKPLTSF